MPFIPVVMRNQLSFNSADASASAVVHPASSLPSANCAAIASVPWLRMGIISIPARPNKSCAKAVLVAPSSICENNPATSSIMVSASLRFPLESLTEIPKASKAFFPKPMSLEASTMFLDNFFMLLEKPARVVPPKPATCS